jgi:putative transposase
VGVNQKTTVGMDLGLTSLWTLSDGRKLDNPRFFKQLDDKLKELQRVFSKTTKGSARRNKLRLLIAKHYRNIRNKKEDFLHKATTKLLSENQVQTVVVEDLNVKSLKEQKHASMNRAVSNASWAKIAYMLEYKSNWLGKNYLSVNPSYTSQVCSSCNHHEGKHELDVREWICTACGTVHDRDINAAINIRNLGLGYSLCVKAKAKRKRDRTCKLQRRDADQALT